MAIDFSPLKNSLDDYDFTVPVGRKTVKISPSASTILRFKEQMAGIKADNFDEAEVLTVAAPLLGGRFDTETMTFTGSDDEDTPNATLLTDLQDAGYNDRHIVRMVGTAAAFYTRGEAFAEEWAKTGDLGKATSALIAAIKKEKAERETPPTTGETNEDA